MPRWLLPALAGIVTFAAAFELLRAAAQTLGAALTHNSSYIDAMGDYQEGGSTRLGSASTLIAIALGGWAALATNARRIDGGVPPSEWRVIVFGLGAITAYTLAMYLFSVTFSRQTRAIPDVLFNLLDFGVLIVCGYAAYRFHQRLRSR